MEKEQSSKKGASASLARAVAMHLEGKRQEALVELNQAIQAGEESTEVHSAKGHLLYELNQYEEAVRSYQRLLELVPNHPTANFNLAICLEKLARWQEAADSFQRAMVNDPDRADTRLGLGICQLHLEKPEPALEQFDRVLSRDEKNE